MFRFEGYMKRRDLRLEEWEGFKPIRPLNGYKVLTWLCECKVCGLEFKEPAKVLLMNIRREGCRTCKRRKKVLGSLAMTETWNRKNSGGNNVPMQKN